MTDQRLPAYILGLDGKRYPSRPLTQRERAYLIGRAHYLAHDEGLSVRQIAARLTDETGLTRAVGTIAGYLKYRCIKCSGASDVVT